MLTVTYNGGTPVATYQGDSVLVAPNTRVRLSVTFITGASTDGLLLAPLLQGEVTSFDSGENYYIGAACLREGSDASFVPSLRISGDLDNKFDVALDDYTSAQVLYDNDGMKVTLDGSGDFTIDAWGDTSSALSPLSPLTNGTQYTISVEGVESTGVVTLKIDGVAQDTDTLTPTTPTWSDLFVFADSTPGNYADGKLYSATLRDGIDGPIVASIATGDAT